MADQEARRLVLLQELWISRKTFFFSFLHEPGKQRWWLFIMALSQLTFPVFHHWGRAPKWQMVWCVNREFWSLHWLHLRMPIAKVWISISVWRQYLITHLVFNLYCDHLWMQVVLKASCDAYNLKDKGNTQSFHWFSEQRDSLQYCI